MALYLRYAVRSDLGLVRTNNEDSVYAGPRLLAIADGMGGHAAGEVASKIVIGTMEPLDEDRRIEDLMAALRDTVAEANHRIAEAVEDDPELDGMGTTLTALRFAGNYVGLVHVGDSRGYLLRGDQLNQITHDATYVQYLVDSGKLTPRRGQGSPPQVGHPARACSGRRSRRTSRSARRAEAIATCSARTGSAMSCRPRPSPTRCRSPIRRTPPTGSSIWPCAAAARTT